MGFKVTNRSYLSSQRGINMVDLMMWLVIASLLLSTALQAATQYQQASYLNNMKSDLEGIGARVLATTSMEGGKMTLADARKSADTGKWSAGTGYVVEQTQVTKKPFIRVAHEAVPDVDAIFLFEPCGNYGAGINVIPKSGDPTCGIKESPEDLALAVPANLSWAMESDAGDAKWWGVGASTNGSTMIASSMDGGKVSVSKDAGQTWVVQDALGASNWRGVSTSGDGNVLVAGSNSGSLYYSTNGGSSWNTANGLPTNGAWWGVAVSNDGSTISANDFRDGYAYISRDSGATWARQDSIGVGKWRSVAVSEDGQRIALGQAPGKLYLSSDAGITWTESNIGAGYWSGLGASLDGKQLVISDYYDGYIQISKDFGENWKSSVSLGNGKWRSVSSSGDGAILTASNDTDGTLYVSADRGITWTTQLEAGIGMWYGVSVSVDGGTVLGGVSTGKLYTGVFTSGG